MARLREIPEDVAQQALTNKTIRKDDLAAAAKGDPVNVDPDELTLLATDVAAPELVPYEYAYTDVYTDEGERFFFAINEKYYRRSSSKTLES
jgi:hypothetical protein